MQEIVKVLRKLTFRLQMMPKRTGISLRTMNGYTKSESIYINVPVSCLSISGTGFPVELSGCCRKRASKPQARVKEKHILFSKEKNE